MKAERVISAAGFVFLVVASISGFYFGGAPSSVLERIVPTKYIIPYTHVFCATLAFISILNPKYSIMIAIFMIESILTVLTNYDMLGIFFFYAAIILLLTRDFFSPTKRPVFVLLFAIHYISLLGTLSRGIYYTIVSYSYSIFCLFFYIWIYKILKSKFSCYLPSNVANNATIPGVKKGSTLKLSDFGLTETQSQFVLANLYENLSFKELSEKHFVSISVVKHEFVKIYKIFGVDNLYELRMLLLQYQTQA